MVADRVWLRPQAPVSNKAKDAAAAERDMRLFRDVVFWRVRTGSQQRGRPRISDHCNSYLWRFRQRGKMCVFNAMSVEYALINSTIVPAHQTASGTKGDPASGYHARGGLILHVTPTGCFKSRVRAARPR